MHSNQHIIIAGAGFGGIRTAMQLARSTPYKITVIADRPTFRYYPALYATATGHSYNESIIPLDEIFAEYPSITVVYDKLKSVNVAKKRLKAESGASYAYDYLVLALGVVTNYFGIKGLDKYSYGIKGESEVADLKEHIHHQIVNQKQLDETYVVIGGGPTGVELSASLGIYVKHIAQCHGLKHKKPKVMLVEAAPRLVPRMSEKASQLVEDRLKSLGVKVMTGAKVEAETAQTVTISGEKVKSDSVIWTSGVTNNPFFKENINEFTLAPNGKVQVDAFMQAAASVYVIGDNAATPYSGLAQTALYDGDFVARNLKRQLKQIPPKAYKARKPPVVIPVGDNWSIFEYGPLVFGGTPGSVLRRAADLIGYTDILPFSKAWRLWSASSSIEENCDVCRAPLHQKYARRLKSAL
ncbi:FAD-dependent oxidoreductase [Candidatus Saccharibacteria bacterium]|nr:FAD-dependent oxidoreductase [Candidatus Saccharibacteria bacterium]